MNAPIHQCSVVCLIAVAIAVSACRDPAPDPPEEQVATGSAAEGPPQGPELPPGWGHLTRRQLNREQLAMANRARLEVTHVRHALAAELARALKTDDIEQAVRICSDVAPDLARRANEAPGIELGRTSFALRNDDNVPPHWALGLIEDRVAEERFVGGPDGRLGYLRPIRMKQKCTRCHGTDEMRDPGVDAVLAELYPQDRAVGFEAGELRGWFWAELTSAEPR